MNPSDPSDRPAAFSTRQLLSRSASLRQPVSILKEPSGPPVARPLPVAATAEPTPAPGAEGEWDASEPSDVDSVTEAEPATPTPPVAPTPPRSPDPAPQPRPAAPAGNKATGRQLTVMDAFKAMAAILSDVKELQEVRLSFNMAVPKDDTAEIVKSGAAKIRIKTPFVEITDEAVGFMFDQRDVGLEICNGAEVDILHEGSSYHGICMARQMTFPGTSWVFISFVLPGDDGQ